MTLIEDQRMTGDTLRWKLALEQRPSGKTTTYLLQPTDFFQEFLMFLDVETISVPRGTVMVIRRFDQIFIDELE